MSHDAITLIASLSVIASLHLSFALRAHIKRTPVLAAINRTEGGDIPSVHIQQCIQMTRLLTDSAWYDYEADGANVIITYWPRPGVFIAACDGYYYKAYPCCTSTSLASGRKHYATTKLHAV